MAEYYKVKNKLSIPLILTDGMGDEVQVPPGTHTVDAKFIDFQMPPLAQAEVIGYDYSKHLAPSAPASSGASLAPSPSDED